MSWFLYIAFTGVMAFNLLQPRKHRDRLYGGIRLEQRNPLAFAFRGLLFLCGHVDLRAGSLRLSKYLGS